MVVSNGCCADFYFHQVTDEQLVAMLAQGEGGESVMGGKKGGVVVQRRRYGMDDDEDDDSDLL